MTEQPESAQLFSSVLSETDPILPVELFSKIIGIVGSRPLGSPLSKNQSKVLQSCALVCRSFAELARDQLFQHIMIGLHSEVEDQFMRFAKSLKKNPALSSRIRELIVELDSFAGGMISEENFNEDKDTLLDLPRLQSLTVLFNSRFTSPPNIYISEFCYDLIDHYSAQEMLCTLHVKTMDELPYDKIFASPVLRELRLDRCLELEEWRAPVPGLRKLTLRKMDMDPSLITCFPNLTDLQLLRTNFFEQEDVSNSCVSLSKFCITSLTLEPSSYHGGRFLPFISFIRRQAIQNGFRPFDHLDSLKVILSHPIRDIGSLLQDTFRLTHFTLQIDRSEEVSSSTIAAEFDACLRTSLSLSPVLERLSLDINVSWHAYIYAEVLRRLTQIFSAPVSPLLHDNLHRIDVSIQLEPKVPRSLHETEPEDRPISQSWLAIESVLALLHAHNFPKLEEVNVILLFHGMEQWGWHIEPSLRTQADKGNLTWSFQFEEIIHEEHTHSVTATFRRGPTQQ